MTKSLPLKRSKARLSWPRRRSSAASWRWWRCAWLVALFLFVFIGPYFVPMDLNYTDPLQANMAPNYSLMSVPDELKNDIRDINGFADFTVGVSNDNDFYIWGNVKNNLTGVDYTAYPERSARERGRRLCRRRPYHRNYDGRQGVGWGNGNNGQYGYLKSENDPYTQMPDELLEGTIDATQVRQLLCGYQATALVMEDGRLYMWGNNKRHAQPAGVCHE